MKGRIQFVLVNFKNNYAESQDRGTLFFGVNWQIAIELVFCSNPSANLVGVENSGQVQIVLNGRIL